MTTQQAVPSTERPPVEPGGQRTTAPLAPIAVGLLVAGGLWAADRWAGLGGSGRVLLAALVLCLLPVSRSLSPRLLILGSLFLGWAPLLWWLPGLAGLPRSMTLVAVGAGLVAASVAHGPTRGRVLPRVRLVDVIPLAAGGLTTWLTWPLLFSSGGDRTLNLLMKSGWDHASHIGMFLLTRREGASPPFLPAAPDGSGWLGNAYPQHFHAAVVGLVELLRGPLVGGTAAEVAAYGQGLALLGIATAVIVCAGVASLPGLRDRWELALPAAGVVLATFVLGPGAMAFGHGWPNFTMAATVTGLVALVGATVTRFSLLKLGAVCGLIVAACHTWLLLAPIAIAASAIAVGSARPWPTPRRRTDQILAAAVVVTSAAAALMVVPILTSSGARAAISAGGPPEFSMSLLVLVTGVATVLALVPKIDARTRLWTRDFVTLLVPLVSSMVLVLGLARYQYWQEDELSYYFGKLVTGAAMIGVACAAVAMARLVAPSPRPAHRRRWIAGTASLLATAASVQWYGYLGPQPDVPFSGPTALLNYRMSAEELMKGPSAEAHRLLDAARLATRFPVGKTSYLAAEVGDTAPTHADQWHLSLAGSYTEDSQRPRLLLPPEGYTDAQRVAETATALVDFDPEWIAIMSPTVRDQVRPLVSPRVFRNVKTWR